MSRSNSNYPLRGEPSSKASSPRGEPSPRGERRSSKMGASSKSSTKAACCCCSRCCSCCYNRYCSCCCSYSCYCSGYSYTRSCYYSYYCSYSYCSRATDGYSLQSFCNWFDIGRGDSIRNRFANRSACGSGCSTNCALRNRYSSCMSRRACSCSSR